MDLPALVSLAALLCYGWLMYIVLRRGFRTTGTVHRLFLAYLVFMFLYQCDALIVSLTHNPSVAFTCYVIWTVFLFGQFVVYAAFLRAFFGIKGHRWIIRIGFALWAVSSLLAIAFSHQYVAGLEWNPATGIYVPAMGPLVAIVSIPNYFFLVYSMVLLYRGYRSANSALERIRVRYLALGLTVVVLGSLTNFVPALQPYPLDMCSNIVNALLIAYAIFRYQLLDISVVIRKGLLYSIPTVLIGIGYFLVLSFALNLFDRYLGYQFFLFSLLLAAVTALVVEPVRDKLQAWVDRLFFRERYDSGLMLQRLSRTAATVLDLDRLSSMILGDITDTMHVATAAFFIKQGETGQYLLRAQQGLDATLQGQLRLRADHPVATWLLRHQTSLIRLKTDTSTEFMGLWAREREELQSMQAELFIPLLVRNDLIGILVLGPKRSELPYSPDDQLTLNTLANQTAIAVDNARLFSLERVKVKATSTMLDVARAVSSTLDLNELLQLIARQAAELCGFDRCNIFLTDRGQKARLVASQRAPGSVEPETRQGPGMGPADEWGQFERAPFVQRAMREQQPIIAGRDVMSGQPTGWTGLPNVNDRLIVPLVSKGQTIGLMTLDHFEGDRRIGEDQIDIAATIASQASVAIENARLYQETLAEKERTATVVEQALAGIVLVDRDLEIVTMNPAVEAITGCSAAYARTRPLSAVLGNSITAQNGLLRQAMSTGKPVGPAETKLEMGAENRDVLLGVMPLSDGYLLSLSDITPLKKLDRLKTEIIANVSHEFRTPLAIIKGYSELLMDDRHGDNATTRGEFLAIIDNAADRLAAMVHDLLDIARLEASQGTVVIEPLSMADIVGEGCGLLHFEACQRNIEVTVDVGQDLPPVQGNHDLLVTIVHNLLSNAIKFSYPGGGVQVDARCQDGWLLLDITDHGIGIPAEDLPHLFEKFYRSAIAKEAGIRGTGLGLVLVKQAVERHNGSITVVSEPSVGTRFSVALPVQHEHDVSRERPPSSVTPADGALPAGAALPSAGLDGGQTN